MNLLNTVSMPTIRQINTSYTIHKGTIRGMHYQIEPYKEAKFIRCTKGKDL